MSGILTQEDPSPLGTTRQFIADLRPTPARSRAVSIAFEHLTLGEITTGRVEWFLKSQAADSSSRAQRSRTMLNLLFGFALRHDAISRNPVEDSLPGVIVGVTGTVVQHKAEALRVAAQVRSGSRTGSTDCGSPPG